MSYPFTTAGFYVAQGWFFIHHIGLVLVLVALALSGAVGNGRLAGAGAWTAVIGMVALTLFRRTVGLQALPLRLRLPWAGSGVWSVLVAKR